MKTTYEWDVETVNEHGDIIDHNHADKLAEHSTKLESDERLVLVRDVGDDYYGLVDRQWAYVENGKLPEKFSDAMGVESANVPKRFHNELRRFLS